jgi:TRAP-type mannitol/chloroaromatic compound transport system permease small subunit
MSNPPVDLDLDAVEAASARGHALDFPRTRLTDAIDAFVGAFHVVANWVWAVLIVLIVVNVALRYALGTNFIAMEELQWHLYAVGFMIGLAYAVRADAHVRVDVIAERFSLTTRAVIEALGIAFFILPLCWIMLTYGLPFVQRAWTINEVSAAPGGLPHRWAIKAVILVAFSLLGLAALSRLIRVLAWLAGRR